MERGRGANRPGAGGVIIVQLLFGYAPVLARPVTSFAVEASVNNFAASAAFSNVCVWSACLQTCSGCLGNMFMMVPPVCHKQGLIS